MSKMSTAKCWKSDEELFTIVQRELFTCVVGDVMDKLDLQHQFLPPQIRPLRQDMVVIGRAMPVLSVDVFAEKIADSANKLMDKSFGLMLEALDDLRTNEVYVNTGSSPRNALGRTHEHPSPQTGQPRRGAEWLRERYQRHSEYELPYIRFRLLRTGRSATLQSTRLPHSSRDWIGARPPPEILFSATLMGCCWCPRKPRPRFSRGRSKKLAAKSWCGRPSKKEVVRSKRSRSTGSCKKNGDTNRDCRLVSRKTDH